MLFSYSPLRRCPEKIAVLTLTFLLFTTWAMAQIAELKTQAQALEKAIVPVQSGSKNYEQQISFTEPALLRYSYDESDQKGNKINYAFELNLADIDPYAVREQTQKDLISVSVTTRNKQKLIKAYKNDVVQPYAAQLAIISKDIENARAIADIIKKAIPLAEKVMASRLKLSGYDAMVNWLAGNVKDVNLGDKSIKQSLVKGQQSGTVVFTREEADSRSSSEEVFTFNLADVNPNAVVYRITGNQFAINFESLQKAKYFGLRKNGESKPYVNEIIIHTNNADEARDLKQVLGSVIPLAVEKVKAGMPAVSNDRDGIQKVAALIGDIAYGDRETVQKLAGSCPAEFTQIQKDPKASNKSVLKFNWMDVNPLASKIEVSGDKMYVDVNFSEGRKLVMHAVDDKLKGYESNIRMYMGDIESARTLKFLMDKVVEKCKASYKEPFGSDVASTTTYFRNNVKELSLDQMTLKQAIEPVDGDVNKFKFTVMEINPKGSGAEQVYEFNLGDINPSSLAVDVKGKWMYVVLETDFKGKIIKYYKDGKIQPYTSALQFAVNDVDIARNLVSALGKAVKAIKSK